MALPENTTSTQVDKPPCETNKHEKREKPPTKVIVRRLPPTMTLPEFIEQVSPLPDYDYIYAVRGDMSLGEFAFSRVYINFTNTEDIFMFKEKFDNYVFVDNKGHEYAAVVEFAAFQKIPKKRGKPRPDPKLATIETEPLYLEFVESLKQQPSQEEKPEFSYQPSNENKNDMSTPLLEYIKKRKIDRMKSREDKREERRKREIERKKLRDEEKRKRLDETSPPKPVTIKQSKNDGEKTPKSDEKEKADKPDKPEKSHEKMGSYKSKDKKFDENKPGVKPKSKYSPRQDKFEPHDKRDYKSRRDEYREKSRRFDDSRKEDFKKEPETKQFTTSKKVKKYSERREERKLEAKKAEQMKEEAQDNKEEDQQTEKPEVEKSVKGEEEKPKAKAEKKPNKDRDDNEDSKSDDQEKSRNKENDPRVQRRIRNKDRPTMQLYQPGMLSKKRTQDDDKDTKEQEKE